MYILIHDDLRVTRTEMPENEIPNLLDSGFVSGVLRLHNGVIEYADVDFSDDSVTWIDPQN